MNSVEISKLSDYRISHLSKSLYTFYLCNLVQKGVNVIDIASVASFLFSSSKYFPTNANIETAVLCLDELEEFNLIKKKDNTNNWQGCVFTLPFYSLENSDSMPSRAFTLSLSWTPSDNFKNSALICGLEDYSYTDAELKAFISYWSNRQEFRNQQGWERAFATRLLKHRQNRVKKDFYDNKDQAANKVPGTNQNFNEVSLIANNGNVNTVNTQNTMQISSDNQTNSRSYKKNDINQNIIGTNSQSLERENELSILNNLFKNKE